MTSMTEMPHTPWFNGTHTCWCGDQHDPTYVPVPEEEWEPFTEADLDALYLEAWLSK